MQDIKVSETLKLELSMVKGPQARLVRDGGGLVVLELSEVRSLIEGLTEAAARLAAIEAGDEFQDNLF